VLGSRRRFGWQALIGQKTLRHWYFCINEAGFDRSRGLLEVAVRSAAANTALTPICLYNGQNPAHVATLEALGVRVIRHRSLFEDDLRAGYGEKFDTFSGHWLRVDIPLIETREDFVLYTDVDVMFLAQPELAPKPALLAAAPEFDRSNLTYFSSGVMVLNIEGMQRVHAEFMAAIRARLHGAFKYPAHDQESFNRFFRGRNDRLPPECNWKPFWGVNEAARIVHFHGPKPAHARQIARGDGAGFMQIYRDLWAKAPEAYEHYARLFDRFSG
jgi:hypothetical protein